MSLCVWNLWKVKRRRRSDSRVIWLGLESGWQPILSSRGRQRGKTVHAWLQLGKRMVQRDDDRQNGMEGWSIRRDARSLHVRDTRQPGSLPHHPSVAVLATLVWNISTLRASPPPSKAVSYDCLQDLDEGIVQEPEGCECRWVVERGSCSEGQYILLSRKRHS